MGIANPGVEHHGRMGIGSSMGLPEFICKNKFFLSETLWTKKKRKKRELSKTSVCNEAKEKMYDYTGIRQEFLESTDLLAILTITKQNKP